MKWGKTIGCVIAVVLLATQMQAGELILAFDAKEREPNDARFTAQLLVFEGTTPPTFWFDGDRDFYSIFVRTLPTTITFVLHGDLGNDVAMQMQDQSGAVLRAVEDNASNDPNINFTHTFEATTATTVTGVYYIMVYAQNFNAAATGYRLLGQLIERDDEPPTYPGGFPGIKKVTRDGMGSALVEWYPAVDNLTPDAVIVYNVYWRTGAPWGLFFPQNRHWQFTGGVTSGTVSGLDPQSHYFMGVRAEDIAFPSNEDQNANYVFAPARLGARPNVWPLYP